MTKVPAKKVEDYSKELQALATKEIELLASKGYDKNSTFRYAKAEKSWCERFSQEWYVWEVVVLMASDE